MGHILARRHLPTLAQFASSNVMIGFDLEGTLAPAVGASARPRLRAVTRRRLGALALRYPCVVISGRGPADASARVGRIPVWHVASHHGPGPGHGEPFRAQINAWVPHKGKTLDRARRSLACDTAIYVGDDETDEDVFATALPGQVLGIRVGRTRHSRARYWLETQDEIDELLVALLALRSGPPHR